MPYYIIILMRNVISDIPKLEGEEVELYGWVHARRDHGKIIFIDLRDRSGLAQVVFTSKIPGASDLRLEYVVKITGTVKKRPESMINAAEPTGAFEVEAKALETVNTSEELPIPVDSDGYEINEEVRMRYRYLDLRRSRLRDNIISRHRIVKYMRDFMDRKGFVEVETPILSKSTPEGARDYLVPSRIEPGKFYALPQSPQQYKQLLMVAGLEKYFQITRCFRDEDTRGDRQPEFTQLDLEMSFATQDIVLNLVEELYLGLARELFPQKKITGLTPEGKIRRLQYSDVMREYHSDKPDLRENKNDPDELAFAFVVNFPMFEKKDDGTLGAVHHPFTMPTFDPELNPLEFGSGSEASGKMLDILGQGGEEDVLELKAYQYDFVLNGYEIGGGSIRTHNPEILASVFKRLGHTEEEVQAQFGHILRAFRYGVPPHGGIAPGIDRFVMLMRGEPNIREVIAFPKSGDGHDFLMDSPSTVDKKQLDELGLEIKKGKK